MPRITLHNTETGKDEHFEPVDAREILANPDSNYTVPKEAREAIGKQLDPRATAEGAINVPQLQGEDAEMQTGNSVDKYGRAAVVKAEAGDPREVVTAEDPRTTSGKPLAKRSAEQRELDERGKQPLATSGKPLAQKST